MTADQPGFSGFGPGLEVFYEGLAADNSREYWQRHLQVYEGDVAGPLRALAASLAKEFGAAKIFRPNRDLRFTPDKRPYKEHASLWVAGARTGGLYCQVSDAGLFLGAGVYQPAAEQLDLWRRAVDDEDIAAEVDKLRKSLGKAGFELSHDNALKTAPRGWPKDHPRIVLLRLRQLTVSRSFPPADWLYTPTCLDEIRSGWRTMNRWNDWLDRRVGAAELRAVGR